MKNKIVPKIPCPVAPPEAPFLGIRIIQGILIDEIIPFINKKALFSGRWQVKPGRNNVEFEKIVKHGLEQKFVELVKKSKQHSLILPSVVYGYFLCQSMGNQLLIFKKDSVENPFLTIEFPRQNRTNGLCLSDYFQPASSGIRDVLAVQIVTAGDAAAIEAQQLYKAGKFQNYFYWHGYAAAFTEALAEYWHQQIRRELEINQGDAAEIQKLFSGKYQGARYSPGYPAFPQLDAQAKIFQLLNPKNIGLSLTDEFQIVPEYSTSAIIVHHPQAKYFNVL